MSLAHQTPLGLPDVPPQKTEATLPPIKDQCTTSITGTHHGGTVLGPHLAGRARPALPRYTGWGVPREGDSPGARSLAAIHALRIYEYLALHFRTLST
ncbi:hypothetical protein LshimejAT787_1601580 [Lyophyllum shimeji]|uniref:Uncharacterized protein n=1 Tax=Lyophyllum shimeji TaxID=47721 RepID=A0A9P3UT37_LYOSH|nr:hypothetical protein LshimejAT787_1601580 [Lyophyllum shimeji]